MTGLLFAGSIVPVPGVNVIPPASHGGPSWAKLDPGDYRQRPAVWLRQVIAHSTGGHPVTIVPGAGPGGEAARIADIWVSDPIHSAAQLVADSAGTVACLGDLSYAMAYHAEGSNEWSIGIEMWQFPDGRIYQATIDATARTLQAFCAIARIPFQHHGGKYLGMPLARMETGVRAAGNRHNTGGSNCVGIFGHRDNTSERGPGDPGDAIYDALKALGSEPLDFATNEDLQVARRRQQTLVARGESIAVDGRVGPASMAAAERQGFARWRDVPTA